MDKQSMKAELERVKQAVEVAIADCNSAKFNPLFQAQEARDRLNDLIQRASQGALT